MRWHIKALGRKKYFYRLSSHYVCATAIRAQKEGVREKDIKVKLLAGAVTFFILPTGFREGWRAVAFF